MDLGEEIVLEKLTCSVLESLKKNICSFYLTKMLLLLCVLWAYFFQSWWHRCAFKFSSHPVVARCKFWQLDTTKRLRLNVSSASIKGESAINRSQNIQKHSNNSFLKRHRQFKMTVGLPEGLLVYNNKKIFTIRSILHLSYDQYQIIIQ